MTASAEDVAKYEEAQTKCGKRFPSPKGKRAIDRDCSKGRSV